MKNKSEIDICPLVESEKILKNIFKHTKDFSPQNKDQSEVLRNLLSISSKTTDILTENMNVLEYLEDVPHRKPLQAPEDVRPVILWIQRKGMEIQHKMSSNPVLFSDSLIKNMDLFTVKIAEIL